MPIHTQLSCPPLFPQVSTAHIHHASPRCLLPFHLLPINGQQLIQFGEELRGCWAVILLAQDESDSLCGRRDCRSENTAIKHWLHHPEECVALSSSSVPKAAGLPFHIFSGHLPCLSPISRQKETKALLSSFGSISQLSTTLRKDSAPVLCGV